MPTDESSLAVAQSNFGSISMLVIHDRGDVMYRLNNWSACNFTEPSYTNSISNIFAISRKSAPIFVRNKKFIHK